MSTNGILRINIKVRYIAHLFKEKHCCLVDGKE